MLSPSEQHPIRHRLRTELWSWSAWLVLAVISYPAVLLIWVAPRAGLASSLVVGLAIVYTATVGYSDRRSIDGWLLPSAIALGAAAGIAAVAAIADFVPLPLVLLAALITTAELIFIWHFLPWLAHDAEQVDAPRALTLRTQAPGARAGQPPRGALALVLLLALLALGVGAAWSRGEARVPSPTIWIVAIALLTFTLMFIERLVFFERSAREGNLSMVPGAYRWWIAGALGTLLLLGMLSVLLPWKSAQERLGTGPTGSRDIPFGASGRPAPLDDLFDSISSAGTGAAGAIGSLPRSALPLLFLLLLLLLLLVLIWGFRRSRATRWILRTVGRFFALLALVSRWLRAWVRSLLPSRHRDQLAPASDEESADPLANPFEDPHLLAGMAARQLIIHVFHLLLDFAEMVGHGRRHNQTPFEYAAVLGQVAPEAMESVRALTWAYSGAMYGGEAAALPDLGSVRDSWERVTSALARDLSAEDLALRHRAWLSARRLDRDT